MGEIITATEEQRGADAAHARAQTENLSACWGRSSSKKYKPRQGKKEDPKKAGKHFFF